MKERVIRHYIGLKLHRGHLCWVAACGWWVSEAGFVHAIQAPQPHRGTSCKNCKRALRQRKP